MKIAGTEFDLNYNSLSIFISGCDGRCKGCHNESLWGFNVGTDWNTWRHKLSKHKETDIVKRYWIMGGEPLLNDISQLEQLLHFLSQQNKELWLWTRYQLKDIPKNILQYCTYVKTGAYRQELESYEEPLFGIQLASTNQKIIKVN